MTETPRVADEDRVNVAPIADHIDLRGTAIRVHGKGGRSPGPAAARSRAGRSRNPNLRPSHLLHRSRDHHSDELGRAGWLRWRKALFALVHRNALRPAAYFNIPAGQVMEIGVELEI